MKFKKYVPQYALAKAWVIRGIYSWLSGAGLLQVITDAGKGIFEDYSKRKLYAAFRLVAADLFPNFLNFKHIYNNNKKKSL